VVGCKRAPIGLTLATPAEVALAELTAMSTAGGTRVNDGLHAASGVVHAARASGLARGGGGSVPAVSQWTASAAVSGRRKWSSGRSRCDELALSRATSRRGITGSAATFDLDAISIKVNAVLSGISIMK
jgi:hypothetical protein